VKRLAAAGKTVLLLELLSTDELVLRRKNGVAVVGQDLEVILL
jgi:hypothetical protein